MSSGVRSGTPRRSGVTLDKDAQIEELVSVIGVDPADRRSVVGLRRDEALVLEGAERLADGDPARTEDLRELLLAQPGSRLEHAGHDGAAQCSKDEVLGRAVVAPDDVGDAAELGELRGPRIGAVDHGARLETVGVDRANVSDRHATHPLVP